MLLLVRLIEARNLVAYGPNGICEPYVRLQLGRQKFRSKVIKKCLNPSWCEEFTFKVDDLEEELIVSLLDEDKYFNHDYVGQAKIPINWVFEARDQTLGTVWYTLCPKEKKAKSKDCGEILLTICFSQNSTVDLPPIEDAEVLLNKYSDSIRRSPSWSVHPTPPPSSSPTSPARLEELLHSKEEKHSTRFASRLANIFNKNVDDSAPSCLNEAIDLSMEHESVVPVELNPKTDEQPTTVDFEEMIRTLEMREQGGEVPKSFSGGIVLDQLYAVATPELASIIFSPDSSVWKSSAEAVGSTDLQMGSWKFENSGSSLKRVIMYTKAPTKIVKALKAIEEHTFLKADGKNFAVLANVDTPDAPYAKNFKVEVLYCITPGPEQPSGELSSRLLVSWRMNFLQSTMMKGIIEGGARHGIKGNFGTFEKILSQVVKPLHLNDIGSEKNKLLASLQVEQQCDWKLAVQYLTNFAGISAVFLGLYVGAHFWVAKPSPATGLEFGLDLPDSITELIVSGVLVLIGTRALESISRFMHARRQKGTDHGIKGRGDGWLLTVALIDGKNLRVANSCGLSDPYVVFTCNGMKRKSSVKFQRSDPLWNEIFEFDATEEPPSVLDVEVFCFERPFAEAKSLGCAKINFLKSNISDLSDIWIPLCGELDEACQPKIHLRIFLNNTKGNDLVKDYIAKMEKEVGKKIKLRSAQTNLAFQKLFGLPPEEFLINDFNCNLKRKMPHQGRLFLSPRIVGFHADLFGHKVNFFFLWEDIEDIQVIPPTLASMGSPIMVIILKPGKGYDAQHGAKTQDAEGRLRFHFHSFVSFNLAHRTIMALWRARTLTPEQKARIAEEESAANDGQTSEDLISESPTPSAVEEPDTRNNAVADDESDARIIQNDGTVSCPESGDASRMFVIYSSMLSLPKSFFVDRCNLIGSDKGIMESAGCLDYTCTPWEYEKPYMEQRQVHYKFDKLVCHYKGEVRSTQQKSPLAGRDGWLIEETMNIRGFELEDSFTICLKYVLESVPSKSVCCIQIQFGITWMKFTRQKKKIAKSIVSNLQKRFKIIASEMEKEYISGE